MLFKDYIYVNEELLKNLSKQLGITISYDTTTTNQINKKTGIDMSNFSAKTESVKTDTENFKNDKYDLLRTFEEKISEDDTGIVDFDFEEADHIFPGQLIKFNAKILQPKGGDENIELINSIKQNSLFSDIIRNSLDASNSDDKKVLDFLFKENNNIPIYFSNDGSYIINSNIDINGLEINYEDFQELYDEEVNVILLTERKYSEEQDIILMDVMKDVLKIGRDLRRTINKEEQEKYIVKEKGPGIKGKILVIYN